MDSSFLTFSPKALLKKKTTKNLNSLSLKLSKTKNVPLQDLSSLKNISKKNNSPSGCNDDSSIIVLEEFTPSYEVGKDKKKCNDSFTYPTSHVSKRNQNSYTRQINNTICLDDSNRCDEILRQTTIQFSHSTPNETKNNKVSFDNSSPQEKFDSIKQWLEELGSIHAEKMYQPAWSTPTIRSVLSSSSELSSVSGGKSSKVISETSSDKSVTLLSTPFPHKKASLKDNTTVKGRISESVSNESVQQISKRNHKIIFCDSDSNSNDSNFLSSRIKSKLKIVSSDSDSDIIKNSSSSVSESRGTSVKGRISGSVSDESVQQISKRNHKIIFCDSDSNSNDSNFLPSRIKSKLKIVSSDSDSDIIKNSSSSVSKSRGTLESEKSRSSAFVPQDSKRNGERKNKGSAGECSDSSACSVYRQTWDKSKVFTPQVRGKALSNVREETPRNSVTSVDDILNTLYGDTWCKEKVLTPQVNKTKAKHLRGKENTPPVNKHSKVMKKCGILVPEISPKISKTEKCAKGVSTGAEVPRTLSFLRSLSASPATNICNPKAVLYKKQFKKKKEDLCFELFKLYNSEVFDNGLPSDMRIEWNVRMNKTAGFCYYSWKMLQNVKVRSSRIELSTKVCTTPDRVRDTLIHELCHAATWILDGVKAGHGYRWKAWANKAMKKFPELPNIKRCHDYSIETKFTYKCKNCGYSIGRHSKSLDLQRKRCGYCYGEFELLCNVKSKVPAKGSVSTPRTPRVATGFALFVKENYKTMKEKHSTLSHAEIMKLLGNDYARTKRVASEQN